MTHVDDFIDAYGPEHTYPRFVLSLYRLPAALQIDFAPFTACHTLFCDYEHKRYRVTGASTAGDIWLSRDFKQTSGYELRVALDDCSHWSDEP
jgi:hypothetical protein